MEFLDVIVGVYVAGVFGVTLRTWRKDDGGDFGSALKAGLMWPVTVWQSW